MFQKGLDPNLKIKIAKATQVPTFLNAVTKIAAAAKEAKLGMRCTATCADEGVADSWVAFVRTIGVTPIKHGTTVTFEVPKDSMEALTLPKRSKRGLIATARAATAGTRR